MGDPYLSLSLSLWEGTVTRHPTPHHYLPKTKVWYIPKACSDSKGECLKPRGVPWSPIPSPIHYPPLAFGGIPPWGLGVLYLTLPPRWYAKA